MRRITVDALANNRGKLLYDKEKYVELVNRAYNNLFGGIEYKTKKNTLFDFMS
jgi:hypothetical protein